MGRDHTRKSNKELEKVRLPFHEETDSLIGKETQQQEEQSN
jgi:hypothetical protein